MERPAARTHASASPLGRLTARRLPPSSAALAVLHRQQRQLPAHNAPPMHYGLESGGGLMFSGAALAPDDLERRAARLEDEHEPARRAAHAPRENVLANPLLRPWYTSRSNSYTVSGAAMGQGERDVLKLGASTKSNFSHFGDTKSVGATTKSVAKSAAATSGITLSYTSYADMEDADVGGEGSPSHTKARKADLLFHFDEEAQYVLELIYEDKDKTFGFEQKKKKKKKNGIVTMIMSAVDDLLLPPAMRPQWEKEQAAMKKEKEEEERMKKLKAERDWKRAGGLKEDDDEDKTAAARLAEMKRALGEGQGERMLFDPLPINGYREQGRFGCVPQRNVDYIRKTKFHYEGERFGGQRDGHGNQAYNDDYVYEGDWVLNQRQGFASLDYPDGSVYEGQFFEGKQHGFGVLRTKDGKTYKGVWELGKKHGFGEMPDEKRGLIFSGQWVAGKRHGFGIQLDLKTGQIYAGQWEFGLKHGEGVVKQRHESMGTLRTRMEWKKGKLLRQEPYDALIHGTEVGEAAMWASHYSKECAMDADLTVAQMIQYPEHPVRPKKEVDYQVQQAQEEAERMAGEDDKGKEEGPAQEEDRMRVPAVEFRRLISLVHSSDSVVEQLVLPILDDAVAMDETETEAACMMVGPIWDENLLKLSHHFATKIQRQWRRTGLKRMVKIAREEAAEGIETDEQRGQRLRKEVDDARIAAEDRIFKQREIESKPFRALQESCDLAVVEEDNRKPNELLVKTRQLFRLEMLDVPSHETRWKMMIAERITRRLDKIRSKGSLWKAAQPKMKNMLGLIGAFNLNKSQSFADMDFAKSKAKILKGQEHEEFLADLEDVDLDLNMVKYTDGTRYYGEVYDGLPQGYGITMNPDGSVYSGQHISGLRDGLGVYRFPMDSGDEDVQLEREYAGEWRQGRRHGFAIERILFKKHVCKSCIVSEYDHDVRSMFTQVNPDDHQEWLDACDVVLAQARGAKIEAENMLEAENTDHGFKATQQIQYDWRSGMSNYTGHYNEQGQKHGLGIQTWHDGQEFAGTFVNDLPHGGGREAYPNNSWYIGSFQNGLRHGWGKYQAANGIIYLGQFQDGMRHGFGIEREEAKDVLLWMAFVKYENNKMVLLESVNAVKARRWLDEAESSVRLSSREASEASPPARIEYPHKNDENALVYIGGTLDGKRAGLGVLTHNNGARYIGEFQQDKKSGLGIETYQDGSVYKGAFDNNRRHGWGEYTDAKSGRTYRGNWVNGQRHGHGWERAVLKMISGNIFKEFLIEYEEDKEISRRFITKLSRLDFLNEVSKNVKRAEEVEELAVEIFEELLD